MTGVARAIGKALAPIFNALTPKPPTRRLGDIAEQTAQEGGARTIIWGRVRPIGGNIIHLQSPQKRMLKVKVKGAKKKQKVEHVYRTYAIGICEGPVSAVIRVWRNNKLVYDARGNAWGGKNNTIFLNAFRLHLGTWQQNPDTALERVWGAGNVPAYRGTCYMVAVDEDLTELGGAVPNWLFEVERAETVDIESDLYPISEMEGLNAGATVESGAFKSMPNEQDSLTTSAIFEGGQLKSILTQQDAPYETLTTGATFEGGTLKSILQQITVEHEQLSTGATLSGGELKAGLIKTDSDTESLTTGATFEGGTLQ